MQYNTIRWSTNLEMKQGDVFSFRVGVNMLAEQKSQVRCQISIARFELVRGIREV